MRMKGQVLCIVMHFHTILFIDNYHYSTNLGKQNWLLTTFHFKFSVVDRLRLK